MPGTIDFQYDSERDIVVATPHWKIASENDLPPWLAQYHAYLKSFGRKMDLVVVLDDFEVAPSIGAKWGEYRARLHKEHLRFSVRVHSKRDVKLFVNTSGVRFNIATEEAASIEDAKAAILEMRRQAKSTTTRS
jgi:hypothetical protein